MPDLPERADLAQLRRQARELMRAAVAGEPQARGRLSAVARRPTLAAAQLAIAREHGYRSWPALRSEVESRRRSSEWQPPTDAGQQETVPGRWSFGGAGAIAVEEGELTPGIVLAGPDGASLEASLVVAPAVPRPPRAPHWFPDLRGVTITDDQGAAFALGAASGWGPESDQHPRYELSAPLSPAPGADSRWLDVHGRGASVTRLVRSGRAPARVRGLGPVADTPAERELRNMASWVLHGYLDQAARESQDLKRRCRNALTRTAGLRQDLPAGGASPLPDQVGRLCTALIRQRPPGGLPFGWHSVLDAADRTDGPGLHVDIDAVLPPADGTTVRLNTLVSRPDSWDLHFQAMPGWWAYTTDMQHKRVALQDFTEDDRGGMYISNFGGSTGSPGYEQVKLTFRPRLNPGATRLTLVLAGQTEQVTVEVPLSPASPPG